MDTAFASAVRTAELAAAADQQGPGYLRWVLLGCLVGVAVLGWLLLHNYRK